MGSKWRGFSAVIALSMSCFILGCGNSTVSYVRGVNASTGLPNGYTIQVGAQGVISSLPYGTEGVQPKGDKYSVNDNSGNYRPIPAGINQGVTVYLKPGSSLASGKQSFLSNADYTIVTLGSSVELQVLTDNNSVPSGGQYKLRFMNASTMASLVDLYVVPVGTIPSGNPTIGNAPFQYVSTYLQESPGTLAVIITSAGNPSNVLATAAFSPAAGNIYSIFFVNPNPSQPPPNSGLTGYGILIVHDPVSATTKM